MPPRTPPSSVLPPRQRGRHHLITGAGSGIGRAVALRLAAEGASVSLLGRNRDKLDAVAIEAIDAGAALAHVVVADLTDARAVGEAVAEAADALGPLDGLVANAGQGGPNFPGEGDRFFEIVQTNLVGTYNSLRAAQRHLAPGPEARHMVVVASILGRFGVPWYTGYCASKAALLGLVRAMALELARENVAVNAICPGWVETDMAWEGIDGMAAAMKTDRATALQAAMSQVPLGRMSQPEDIGGLVAWLLSNDARGVTGQGIDMNNGAWMG